MYNKAEYFRNFVYMCKMKIRTSGDSTVRQRYEDFGTCLNGM